MIEAEPNWPAYLLGAIPWPSLELAQRRLNYDITGDSRQLAAIFCDHSPGITIGRAGSRSQIRLTDEKLRARGWPIRWMPHGGGVMLHLPGQVACYPQLHLDRFGLTPGAYVQLLAEVVQDLLKRYQLVAEIDPEQLVLRVRGRVIAAVGVAIRSQVTSFGFVLNVCPDLECFREVQIGGDTKPMTSLQRECPQWRARVPTVRGQLLELLANRLGLGPWSIFHHHPLYLPRTLPHARTAVTR